MRWLGFIYAILLNLCAFLAVSEAQQAGETTIEIEALSHRPEDGAVVNIQTGMAIATNGVIVRYGDAVLTAERVAVNYAQFEVIADGDGRIQQGEQVWVSQHIRYNFKTRQMEAQQFRTGQNPVFATGVGLHADLTNNVYIATNAMLTSDDISEPAFKI